MANLIKDTGKHQSQMSLTENPVHHSTKNLIFLQFQVTDPIDHPPQGNCRFFQKYFMGALKVSLLHNKQTHDSSYRPPGKWCQLE
jgi:hypothetical protein